MASIILTVQRDSSLSSKWNFTSIPSFINSNEVSKDLHAYKIAWIFQEDKMFQNGAYSYP